MRLEMKQKLAEGEAASINQTHSAQRSVRIVETRAATLSALNKDIVSNRLAETGAESVSNKPGSGVFWPMGNGNGDGDGNGNGNGSGSGNIADSC
ncbi:hypothetical protein AWZ03_003467 [Drosophila navojoa]|uniref:Uncharacterized protein n=1 Tax=Drosophila navojoa TaxID=7232 RepID=A0A484BME6_DRONA|nr:hypothetical protein AWZ03_003467 [Drosophila navojoa]